MLSAFKDTPTPDVSALVMAIQKALQDAPVGLRLDTVGNTPAVYAHDYSQPASGDEPARRIVVRAVMPTGGRRLSAESRLVLDIQTEAQVKSAVLGEGDALAPGRFERQWLETVLAEAHSAHVSAHPLQHVAHPPARTVPVTDPVYAPDVEGYVARIEHRYILNP